jgi:nucleoside-diphosphate-sugar epimerase
MSERVLVTGSEGFIGKALVNALRLGGHEVRGFDQAQGDLSRDRLSERPELVDVTRVLHLAARTYVPDSWRDPFAFYEANVMGTVNVLEFCRRRDCPVTLMSSYLYGPPLRLPLAEDHPLDPNSPYNHSKALVEQVGAFYARKFSLAVSILRPFNIYGPGQRADFLLPSLVRQALDPQVETIEVADLEPRRDYLYIDDLVTALVATLHGPRPHAVYNIGSGQSYSVAEVIATVQEAAGTQKRVVSRGERRPGEVMDTVADIKRARAELGWEPAIPFHEGIRRLVAAAREKHAEN